VHRGIVSEGDVEEFLSLYAGALGMRGIVVGQFGFHPFAALKEIPDGWPEEHTRFREQDPALPFLERQPGGTPYVISEHLDGPMRRLPIYAALCRADIADALILRFRTVFRNEIFLTTYRRKGMRSVSSDDAVLARLLYPHCAAALSAKTAVLAIEHTPIDPRNPQADGHAHVSFPRLEMTLSSRAKNTWMLKLGIGGVETWRRVERIVLRAAVDFCHGEPSARSRLGARVGDEQRTCRCGSAARGRTAFQRSRRGSHSSSCRRSLQARAHRRDVSDHWVLERLVVHSGARPSDRGHELS
jgi:hypothetical protein